MTITNVQMALNERFASGSYFPEGRIGTENTSFVPPDDLSWCHLFFLPNLPSVGSLGVGGRDEIDGIFQIDLNYKIGTGTMEIGHLSDMIRQDFKAGTKLNFNGQEVLIVNCGRNGGRVVNGWFKISVSVQWYAQLVR